MTQSTSQDSTGLASWMNATTSTRNQITGTVYDVAAWTMSPLMTQQNLRNRVSYTYTMNHATDPTFYTATYYTYDVHGNVDTLIQDYLGLSSMSTTPYKRICYDYDLVSGKVNGVDYQPGNSDAFYYRYLYDAENRLTNVWTSRDSITWEQDASYFYYKHGPLSHMVLGQLQTQGIDYTYTLQGWLKGTNIGNGYAATIVDSAGSFCAPGSALSDVVVQSRSVTDTPYTYTARSSITFENGFETYDGDSLQTDVNSSLTACNLPSTGGDTTSASGLAEAYPVAQDAYSYSLHYYPGDYNAIGATTPVTDVLTTLGAQASPLYNGNIAASAVVLPGGLRPQVYSYQYDQLNRLVQMKVDTGLNAATHTFTPVSLPDYGERVAYDPNGNINGYVRHGYGAHIPMDSLTYHYYANTNQLQRINDSAGGSYTTDLKDQGTGNNYTYDLNGQLKQDAANGVSAIDWTVYGKIDTIVNGSGTIVYTYDAAGNRITKSVGGTNSIYVRDAQGNILAIYTQSGAGAPLQTEVDLYGSSRLGTVGPLTVAPTSLALSGSYGTAWLNTFSRGEKSYELTNHLGNVLSTITDKKIAVSSGSNSSLIDHFLPDVATAQDYYPFGMLMPGRTFGTLGRYAFNGKEQDPEVEGTGNFYDYGMRGYDSRVDRFPSVDPLTKKYPWYTPYSFAGNKPIAAADLDGMEEWMKTTGNLSRENVVMRIDATRLKEQSKIPHLSATPYEDQVQQYQHEQNNIRQWNAAGYNDDGSKPFLKTLSDNKTWNNFAENLALPLLNGASLIDGVFQLANLAKLAPAIETFAGSRKVSFIRDLLGVDKTQNIGFLEGSISNTKINAIAISGQKSVLGTVSMVSDQNRVFSTQVVGGYDRLFDSEVKLLENFAETYRFSPNVEGSLKLTSERTICTSCSGVIEQFQKMFPKVKLEIVNGTGVK